MHVWERDRERPWSASSKHDFNLYACRFSVFAVYITQMEMKWSWNNKKYNEHLLCLMIVLQIIDSELYNRAVLIFKMPLTQLAVICKFIDCGILLFIAIGIQSQSIAQNKWFSGTLSFIFAFDFCSEASSIWNRICGKRLKKIGGSKNSIALIVV